MPTTRFETTIKALGDLSTLKPEAAIKNIEGWETYLKDHDAEGAKKIIADLEKLKKLLAAEDLDDSKIKPLLVKLGKETAALAKGDKVPNASHIEKLGTTLQEAL